VPPGPENASSATVIVPATSRCSAAGAGESVGATDGSTDGAAGSTDGVAGAVGDGAGEDGAPMVVPQAARTIMRIEMGRMDWIG